MEDKKRKKFGLSLKNAKRLAVTKSKVNEQRSTKNVSSINLKKVSKEYKNLVVDAGQSSCDPQECGVKGKLKPSEKTLGKEKLVCLDNSEQERERMLWQNLFSVSSTTNWETMEDLPIPVDVSSTSGMKNEAASSMKIGKKFSMKTVDVSNTFPGSLSQATQKMDAFDIDLDYKDLPKPCIACYARKHHPLTWSQEDYDDDKDYDNDDNDDNDKRMEENVIYISPPPKTCTFNTNNSSMKRNSQNNLSSIVLAQDSETNVKPRNLFNQDMEHKKKSYLQTNSNSNRIVKNNRLSKKSSARNFTTVNSPLKDLTTTTDLSSNVPPRQKSLHREFGKSVDLKKPSGLISDAFKVKSKKLNSNVDDSEGKRNFAAAKKEILQCCPICQMQFSRETSKEEIDLHISNCIKSEEIFIDDDDDDKEEW